MKSHHFVATALLGLLGAAASAQTAPECPNAQLFLMDTPTADLAQVGIVGHVDNGTFVDSGQYRAQIVVNQELIDAVTASLRAGCTQVLRQASTGSVTLLGSASGSYSARLQLYAERPRPTVRRRVGPPIRDLATGPTDGTVTHTHDLPLPRALMTQMRINDVLALEGTVTASATIINGWVFDQAQVLYTWGTTPWVEVRLP